MKGRQLIIAYTVVIKSKILATSRVDNTQIVFAVIAIAAAVALIMIATARTWILHMKRRIR